MRAGKLVILCDNTEHEYQAQWVTVSRSVCEAEITKTTHVLDISSAKAIHLYVPPLKNQARWELILEKCTEIGIASYTPLLTDRTEVESLRKPERLERIIKEAAEQSGRTKLPTINPPMTLEECLANEGANLIASLEENSQTIPKTLSTMNTEHSIINLYIGPVGDFTPEELENTSEHNFYSISLGKQILRTETAAIVAAVLCL